MKAQHLAVTLTVVNLVLLACAQAPFRTAAAQGDAPVLRGSALEIVDKEGRVRASIKVHPGGPAVPVPDGRIYPETVVIRIIDADGRPSVKLAGSHQGAGLSLLGDSQLTYLVLKAEGAESSLKLLSKGGREQIIKP